MRVLLVLVFALVARAAQPAQAPAVTPMAIVSADTDAGAGTLTIGGTGFGTRPTLRACRNQQSRCAA